MCRHVLESYTVTNGNLLDTS